MILVDVVRLPHGRARHQLLAIAMSRNFQVEIARRLSGVVEAGISASKCVVLEDRRADVLGTARAADAHPPSVNVAESWL